MRIGEHPECPGAAPWFVVTDLLTDPQVDINIFANIGSTCQGINFPVRQDRPGFALFESSVLQQAINYMLFR